MCDINNLPLEIRLNIMSYNCYDICPYRYSDILKNHFPTWERVQRNPFWAMTLTEALDDTKSDCEIHLELKAFYNSAYIYDIENTFKQLWFIDSIDDKREHLRMGYYDAMRALLVMMPFRTEAEWHIRFYHISSTEDFYDEDEQFSDNESAAGYY